LGRRQREIAFGIELASAIERRGKVVEVEKEEEEESK